MTNLKIKSGKEKGSTALLTVLIVSAILLILVVGMSDNSITSSYENLNHTSDQVAHYAAEACLEETLSRIEDNINFTGTTITSSDSVCTSTVIGGATKTINIDISYLDYEQTYEAQASAVVNGSAVNVSLLKWEQI